MRVPAPMATWTAVFRRDGRVWRQTLSRGAFAILSAVCAGAPLAEALARGRDVADVGSLFRGFASDGLFSDLRTSSSAP